MKHLYESLRTCAKEEEVKAEFCKFFKMKIFALRGIDHYTENVLFEFKYDRGFIFPIKCFYGATGNFPVGFLVWNLAKRST